MTETTVTEGRAALEKLLRREADRARETMTDAMATTKRRIEEAERRLAADNWIPTSVAGDGMILDRDGENLNRLASEWTAAERRYHNLLDLYDATNGTAPEGTPVSVTSREADVLHAVLGNALDQAHDAAQGGEDYFDFLDLGDDVEGVLYGFTRKLPAPETLGGEEQ